MRIETINCNPILRNNSSIFKYNPNVNLSLDIYEQPIFSASTMAKITENTSLETCFPGDDCEGFKYVELKNIDLYANQKGVYYNDYTYIINSNQEIIKLNNTNNKIETILNGTLGIDSFIDIVIDKSQNRLLILNKESVADRIDYVDLNSFSAITTGVTFTGSTIAMSYNETDNITYVIETVGQRFIYAVSANTIVNGYTDGSIYGTILYNENDGYTYAFQQSNGYFKRFKDGLFDSSYIFSGDTELQGDLTISNFVNIGNGDFIFVGSPSGGFNKFLKINLENKTIIKLGESDIFRSDGTPSLKGYGLKNDKNILYQRMTYQFSLSDIIVVTDISGNTLGYFNDELPYNILSYDTDRKKILLYRGVSKSILIADDNYVFRLDRFKNNIPPFSGYTGINKLDLIGTGQTFNFQYDSTSAQSFVDSGSKPFLGIYTFNNFTNKFNPTPIVRSELPKIVDTVNNFTGTSFYLTSEFFKTRTAREYLFKTNFSFSSNNFGNDVYYNSFDSSDPILKYGLYNPATDGYYVMLRNSSGIIFPNPNSTSQIENSSGTTLITENFFIPTTGISEVVISSQPIGDVIVNFDTKISTRTEFKSTLTGVTTNNFFSGNTVYFYSGLNLSGKTISVSYLVGQKNKSLYNEIIRII